MYKIYINEIPLILKSSDQISQNDHLKDGFIIARYTGKSKHLLNFIDLCEKGGSKLSGVLIYHHDLDQLKNDFKTLYTTNKAAGGIVLNEKDEILVIFRRGWWDLPKGKIEVEETKQQAAVREVIEETGIKNVQLLEKVGVTRHTFKNKLGARILKKSIWFVMRTKKQPLKPQKAEDIEQAKWMPVDKFLKTCKPIYKNIIQILETYQALSKEIAD
jgi:8-oxo-dGTP pyrophosphatase MutT (NUDIX family)